MNRQHSLIMAAIVLAAILGLVSWWAERQARDGSGPLPPAIPATPAPTTVATPPSPPEAHAVSVPASAPTLPTTPMMVYAGVPPAQVVAAANNPSPVPVREAYPTLPRDLAGEMAEINHILGEGDFLWLMTSTLPPGAWNILPAEVRERRTAWAEQLRKQSTAPGEYQRNLVLNAWLQMTPTLKLNEAGDRATLRWQHGSVVELNSTFTVSPQRPGSPLAEDVRRAGPVAPVTTISPSGMEITTLPGGLNIATGGGNLAPSKPLELPFVKVNGQWYLEDPTPIADYLLHQP